MKADIKCKKFLKRNKKIWMDEWIDGWMDGWMD